MSRIAEPFLRVRSFYRVIRSRIEDSEDLNRESTARREERCNGGLF